MSTYNSPSMPSTPSMNIKTSFIPSINGGWWAPSYYVFILTIFAVLINLTISIIQSQGTGVLSHLVIAFSYLLVTYYSARSSTCLWSGGCRIFSVFTLMTPIIMLLTLIFKDITNIKNPNKDSDTPQLVNPILKPKPSKSSKADTDDDTDDEEEYPEPPDGGHKEPFTNSFPEENYRSYCPY